MHLEQVDPRSIVETASAILQDAWQPPCLHYSRAYVDWQFNFPGAFDPIGVIAYEGNEPAGLIAAMPRRLRHAAQLTDLLLLSFFAVRPAWRGSGLATLLLDALMDAIPRDASLVTFTEPASRSERVILRAGTKAGFRHFGLGLCRPFAFLASPITADFEVAVHQPNDPGFLSCIERCSDSRFFWDHPTVEQMSHYQSDPRERIVLAVRGGDGAVCGAAMATCSDIVTPQGPTKRTIVNTVYVPQPDPAILSALFTAAQAHFETRSGSPALTITNLSWIDPAIVRQTGARATQAGFRCHLFLRNGEQNPRGVSFTNLDVV